MDTSPMNQNRETRTCNTTTKEVCMSRFRAGDVVRTPGNQISLVYEVVNEQVNKYAPPPGAGLAIMADRDGTPKGYGGHQYTRVTLYPDDPREAIEVIGHNAEQATAAAQYFADAWVSFQHQIHEGEPIESPDTIEGWLQHGILLAEHTYTRYSSLAGGEPIFAWDKILQVRDVGYVQILRWNNAPGSTYHAYPYQVRHLTHAEAVVEAQRERESSRGLIKWDNRPKLTTDGERFVLGA